MQKKAFTLVEILTVIVIFGIGILAILKLLTNSIGYFDTINMQTRATLLAKEALDLAFHYRDSNILQGSIRNFYSTENEEENYREASNQFKISLKKQPEANSYISLIATQKPEKTEEKSEFDQLFETFAMNIWKNGNYHYLSDLKQENTENPIPNKWFARWISFEAVKGEDWNPITREKLLKISAHALYKRWGTTWEVVLESFIGVKDGSIQDSENENSENNFLNGENSENSSEISDEENE